ncbi:MAG: hypothetical protein ACREPL_03435 [Rhodanobacteraceae bacterium]
MSSTDKATVLDLLALVDDHRRSSEIAAVLSAQPARRAQASAVSQKDAAMTSIVRRGMARLARSHASEQEKAQEIDTYVRLLVDHFLGESSGGELRAPRPRERKAPGRSRGAGPGAKGTRA